MTKQPPHKKAVEIMRLLHFVRNDMEDELGGALAERVRGYSVFGGQYSVFGGRLARSDRPGEEDS